VLEADEFLGLFDPDERSSERAKLVGLLTEKGPKTEAMEHVILAIKYASDQEPSVGAPDDPLFHRSLQGTRNRGVRIYRPGSPLVLGRKPA
jgi:hypothetical protein